MLGLEAGLTLELFAGVWGEMRQRDSDRGDIRA